MVSTSHSVWSLVAGTAYLLALVNAAGVLDVGLVFPRANETYEPSAEFPIVWVFQNASLAKPLDFRLQHQMFNTRPVTNWTTVDPFNGSLPGTSSGDGSEPYFYWTHVKLDAEGLTGISWSGSWVQCEEMPSVPGSDQNPLGSYGVRLAKFEVPFEIKRGGQKVDLVAATANDEACPHRGFAINVTDEKQFPAWNITCAVMDFSNPLPAANPCRVKIDKATVERIEGVEVKDKCSVPSNKPADCPKENHAVKQFATAGIATLTAVLGTLVFVVA